MPFPGHLASYADILLARHALLQEECVTRQKNVCVGGYRAPCSGTKMDVVQTRQCPELKNVHKQLDKGINYREISAKFGVSASTVRKKVNTVDIDENLLRLVPVLGHDARELPLQPVSVPGRCPNYCSGTNKRLCSDWYRGTKPERGLIFYVRSSMRCFKVTLH